MSFFSETRPLLGHFLKKSVFYLLEMSNTCKKFVKYGTLTPFSPRNLYYNNGSEWPKIHFKTPFERVLKVCRMITCRKKVSRKRDIEKY